jgi:hypothetical protein
MKHIVPGPVVSLAMMLCTSMTYSAPAAKPIRIEDVPHVMQEEDFCGEACVEMYLRKLGYTITQHDVFNASGLDPTAARGCHTKEMVRALSSLGFEPGVTWNKIRANSAADLKNQWAALLADLKKQIPSIVCMRTGKGRHATEHFRLVLGYDPEKGEVIYHEPGEWRASYRRMKLADFLDCWPLKYKRKEWLAIRMRLQPRKITVPEKQAGFTNADFALHIMGLKKRMPKEGFSLVVSPPFVVIGDERPSMVTARAQKTVKWATLRLKERYFKKDPAHIHDIWLFKDKTSYMKHAKLLFNDTPDTPFGYASAENRALVMNIGTGGGTLVHEIVHPFIAVNFPQCPSWLNEGLGSLYEQSRGKGKDIVGLTNWRLEGLQAAIKKKQVPSFKELTGTTNYEFYRMDTGSNYAQARYLCYYLQEKGLLKAFYHQCVANQKGDPTGYKTLQKILKAKDMDAFKTTWEKYVMRLTFP